MEGIVDHLRRSVDGGGCRIVLDPDGELDVAIGRLGLGPEQVMQTLTAYGLLKRGLQSLLSAGVEPERLTAAGGPSIRR
jgi:hypothetical protein